MLGKPLHAQDCEETIGSVHQLTILLCHGQIWALHGFSRMRHETVCLSSGQLPSQPELPEEMAVLTQRQQLDHCIMG